MRNSLKTAHSLCLILLLVCCTGCFELTESFKIQPDGSFEMRLTFGLDDDLLDAIKGDRAAETLREIRRGGETIARSCTSLEGVTRCEFQEYEEDDLRRLRFEVEGSDFRSITAIQSLLYGDLWSLCEELNFLAYEMEFVAKSTTEVAKSDQGLFRFVRTFSRAAVTDPKLADQPIAAIALKDRFINVNLVTPHVAGSNGRIADDKKSTKWAIRLTETLDEKFERALKAEFSLETGDS